MRILDRSFDQPADNLACDEVLLDLADAGGEESLRFWESPVHFVVLGFSNVWKEEVRADAVEKDALPILRRPSGGGTVLQGPGCLNYALALRLDKHKDLSGILSSNRFVMEKNRAAMEKALGRPVRVQGATDLTTDDLKFSGNSQRRKKNALLFHGTFLVGFDLDRIERYLKMPPKKPAYRKDRTHLAFVANTGIARPNIKEAMIREWDASGHLHPEPLEAVSRLSRGRYSDAAWNFCR